MLINTLEIFVWRTLHRKTYILLKSSTNNLAILGRKFNKSLYYQNFKRKSSYRAYENNINTKDASIGHLESVKFTLKNLVTRKNTLKSIGVGSKMRHMQK